MTEETGKSFSRKLNLNSGLLTVLTCFFSFSSFAQSYFQQHVSYKISVKLDDKKHMLEGFESLVYTNNSMSSLSEIYFHLYPNAYKDNSTALADEFLRDGNLDFQAAPDSLRGYIDGLEFKVNDMPVKMEMDAAHIDICKLILNDPIGPGGSITITTPFKVKIPDAKFSRMGHSGQAYYISQWYPKPAVFDKNGWHPMPYLSQGEFYSEFGSFEVSITLPQNYVVGATGNLQEQSEINFLNFKSEETRNRQSFEKTLSFPPSDAKLKTITYKIDSVHDFAWFADKRFHVLKSTVELPHSKNRVTTFAMFTNSEAGLWKEAPEYMNNALYFYSLWNGDYPYSVCTVIDGVIAAGGGMEYPTISVVGKSYSAFFLEDVIVHEVGHNWFYGILGTNERAFAWMDEGINTFNELRYFQTHTSASKGNPLLGIIPFSGITGAKDLDFKEATMIESMVSLRNRMNQPLSTPAKDFSNLNYALNTYTYTGVLFNYLKAYLGDSIFDHCMQTYFTQWKFKHPYPEDLKAVFEKETSLGLSWFFDELINTNKRIDYAVKKVEKAGEENTPYGKKQVYKLKMKNREEAVVPFSVSSVINNRMITTRWYKGFKGESEIEFKATECDRIEINADGDIPDINNKNNIIRTRGVFKKFEPVKLQVFPRIQDVQRSQLFVLPVVGYNAHNGFMGGISFSNYLLEKKSFEYHFTPMYGFESKSMAGVADLNYTCFFDHGLLHHITVNANPRYFAYLNDRIKYPDGELRDEVFNYFSIPAGIKFFQRKKPEADEVQNAVEIKSIYNIVEQYNYLKAEPGNEQRKLNTLQVIASRISKSKLDPYELSITVEAGEEYTKAFLELNKSFSYGRSVKGIKLRFFGGGFINDETNGTSSFTMSAWNGRNDYLFNDYFLARNDPDAFLNQQMVVHDGGFKSYFPGARSNEWLAAVNAEIKLPFLPVKFFADAGTYHNAGKAYEGSEALVYDAGIAVSLINNVCEIYFPFIFSNDIKNYHEVNDLKFGDKIRFTLNIKSINLLNLRQKLIDFY